MSGPNEPKPPPLTGSGGQGNEPDFESDALLDSLTFDEIPAPRAAPCADPHQVAPTGEARILRGGRDRRRSDR